MSADGQWAVTVDRHTVLLWCTASPSRPALALAHTKPLSCAALSSDGSKLAAGDTTGRILVWHDVAATAAAAQQAKAASGGATIDGSISDGEGVCAEAELRLPPATTVHWHAHEVSCLTFSVDDAYLLSGEQLYREASHAASLAPEPSQMVGKSKANAQLGAVQPLLLAAGSCLTGMPCPGMRPQQGARRRCWSCGMWPPARAPTCPAWGGLCLGWRPAAQTPHATLSARCGGRVGAAAMPPGGVALAGSGCGGGV